MYFFYRIVLKLITKTLNVFINGIKLEREGFIKMMDRGELLNLFYHKGILERERDREKKNGGSYTLVLVTKNN